MLSSSQQFRSCSVPDVLQFISRAALTFSDSVKGEFHKWATFGEETPLTALDIIVQPGAQTQFKSPFIYI